MMMERLNKIYLTICDFYKWWLAELFAMVPDKVLKLFKDKNADYILYISKNDVKISHHTKGEKHERIFNKPLLELQYDEDFIAYLKDNITDFCMVKLSNDLYLEREVELPKAAVNEFKNIIKYQIPKLLPMAIDDIYYDCTLSTKSDYKDYINVNLAMVKKIFVDEIVMLIEQFGIGVKSFSSHSNKNHIEDYQFQNLENKYKSKNRMIVGGLMTASICLIMFAGILIDHRFDRQEEILTSKITKLSARSKEVLFLEEQVSIKIRQLELLKRQNTKDRIDNILLALTSAIPKDSWVYDLRKSGLKITLQGTSLNSSVIVENLSKIPLFEDLSNTINTVVDQDGKSIERFTLSAKLNHQVKDGENINE